MSGGFRPSRHLTLRPSSGREIQLYNLFSPVINDDYTLKNDGRLTVEIQ